MKQFMVKSKDIAPEIRMIGRIVRRILPTFTEQGLIKQNKLLGRMRGKHSAKKCRYEQIYIDRADGTKLRLCVYSPLEPRKNAPGVLWLHGGGYAIQVPEMETQFIYPLLKASGCVVAPDYTLSTEAPYPAGVEDCYAALLWLRDNGAKYGMRSDQIFVGGDSAGGGLTAAISLLARDRGEVNIAFQMPLYPMIDDRPTKSNTNNDAPAWNSKANDMAWRLYLRKRYRCDDLPAYAAPARCTNYVGLPPSCCYVGNIEPFYDETVTYMENLKAVGVPIHFKVMDGCFHGFDIIAPFSKPAKQARAFWLESFAFAVTHYFAAQPESLMQSKNINGGFNHGNIS